MRRESSARSRRRARSGKSRDDRCGTGCPAAQGAARRSAGRGRIPRRAHRGLDAPAAAALAAAAAPGEHGGGEHGAGAVPRRRPAGDHAWRPHRPGAWRGYDRRRRGALAGADAPDRVDRSGAARGNGRSRRDAAAAAGGGGRTGPGVPARPGRARQRHARRQRFDQCRRQPRVALRHDARDGAGPGSGSGRRHGDSVR